MYADLTGNQSLNEWDFAFDVATSCATTRYYFKLNLAEMHLQVLVKKLGAVGRIQNFRMETSKCSC